MRKQRERVTHSCHEGRLRKEASALADSPALARNDWPVSLGLGGCAARSPSLCIPRHLLENDSGRDPSECTHIYCVSVPLKDEALPCRSNNTITKLVVSAYGRVTIQRFKPSGRSHAPCIWPPVRAPSIGMRTSGAKCRPLCLRAKSNRVFFFFSANFVHVRALRLPMQL